MAIRLEATFFGRRIFSLGYLEPGQRLGPMTYRMGNLVNYTWVTIESSNHVRLTTAFRAKMGPMELKRAERLRETFSQKEIDLIGGIPSKIPGFKGRLRWIDE